MTRHDWDHNKPSKDFSTCYRCELSVKTYRIKKGRLPSCDYVQTEEYRINEIKKYRIPCVKSTPPLACLDCEGRIKPETCDIMRREWGNRLAKTGLIIDLTH